MTELLALLVTLGTYQIGLFCQKRLHHTLVNPLLIAIILSGLFVALGPMSSESYQEGNNILYTLLTPATVSLAVPLYTQLRVLRRYIPALLLSIFAGVVACLMCVGGLALAFGLDSVMIFSLLPKGVTTAMGTALSEQTGGISAITTVAIIFTGLLGSVLCKTLCKFLHVTNPMAQGVAIGTAAHGIGTAKAFVLSELVGASSSLSMVVAGVITAVVIPIIYSIL